MDPRLIDYYEAELEYLKARSLEFAEQHETVATRLGLNSTDRDPYVELHRLPFERQFVGDE